VRPAVEERRDFVLVSFAVDADPCYRRRRMDQLGAGAEAERRDAGLLRAVGPWALAASIVNSVVGAGIFAVPGALAACVGLRAPLVLVGCALAVGSVAICFAEGGSRVPTSGGPYGYVEAAFGPFAGYVAGTLLWFSDALACGGIAAGLADAVAAPLDGPARVAARSSVVIVVVTVVALVNVAGVAKGARLVAALTALKLVPIALFLVVGVTAVGASRLAEAVPPEPGGLGRAAILALFAFQGMESSLCASGEVARPARTIPRALVLAMLFVTLLYVAIQLVAQGILGASLARSSTPLADALGTVHPALRGVMLAAVALSMLGWIASDLLGTPRMVFALARDGWLPRVLARVHPRTHAPHVAIGVYAALAMGLALSGTFTELAVLSSLAIAPLYIAGCVAAWTLARRGVALAGEPFGFRALGAAVAVGIAAMIGLIALASRAEIAGLVGLVVVSAVSYVPLSRRVARLRLLEARDDGG
jgi:amino acid transporter